MLLVFVSLSLLGSMNVVLAESKLFFITGCSSSEARGGGGGEPFAGLFYLCFRVPPFDRGVLRGPLAFELTPISLPPFLKGLFIPWIRTT